MAFTLKLVFGLCFFVGSNSIRASLGSQPGTQNAYENSQPALPESMGSLGDSITAGAIADYDTSTWKKPTEVFTLLRKLTDLGSGKNPESVERKDLSWTSGHAKRIRTQLERQGREWTFELWNGARSGHASKELLELQLPKLLEWSRKTLNQGAPDYVTILIGPNDICNDDLKKMTEVHVFKDRMTKVLSKLFENNAHVKILISELPDVERVWRIAKNHKLSKIHGAKTCQDVWNRLPFCANLLRNGNDSDRLKMRQRAEDYIDVLKSLAERFSQSFPDQVRVAEGIYNSKFEINSLSADCFHPNVKGQKNIEQTTWGSSWWPES